MPRKPIVAGGYERRRQRLLADLARGDVLDLGHAHLPNPFLDGDRTVGLDLEAPRRPSGYRRDVVGSVFDVGTLLDGARFDTVVAAELIEHIEDPYAFLRSVRPLIADGGRLVLSTPNPLGFPAVFAELVRSRRFFYAEDHKHYFLPRWVVRMLEGAGFRVDDVRAVGVWLGVAHIPISPIWLSYQVIYVASPLGP